MPEVTDEIRSSNGGRAQTDRSIGLFGATGVGVGAIVGGGILALSGVAFATTGPSAILAFGLNGIIAVVTALSFAELATRFPESGGTYAFARKVLSIEAAFTVGWVVWFASIVASALYAIGFGAFTAIALDSLWRAGGSEPPPWLVGGIGTAALGFGGTAVLTLRLMQKSGSGGPWLNIGKVAVFGVLIAVGLWKLAGRPPATIGEQLQPFFAKGGVGLITAMGYTFIALQGFDLIAAIGGEVRDPRRTIPRAMLMSLGLALAIYMPLLLIVATVGMPPGESVTDVAAAAPEAVVAIAAKNYLGGFGYWLVLVAAILSMLSALQANLLAASRVAQTMARDRTLPHWMEPLHGRRGTPTLAILVTAGVASAVIIGVPDVASVGAASSLVFLLTFALVQRLTIMARRRAGVHPESFRVPGYPVLPWVGGLACIALALFQGINVLAAGIIAGIWLSIGGVLYALVFSRRARRVDAFSQAMDADLVRLRGRSPLVLVPLANPANAEAMVGIANALAPPRVGRVLLLTIVRAPEDEMGPDHHPLDNAQSVMAEALHASFARSLRPEVLTTVATNPWPEIVRVARTHACESLLLGFSHLTDPAVSHQIEAVMNRVTSEVVVLRAPPGWLLRNVRRVLVPIAGRGGNDILRARLLGSIHRLGAREITLLRVLPEGANERHIAMTHAKLTRIARDEVPQGGEVIVACSSDPLTTIVEYAADCDLVVLGTRRTSRQQKSIGNVVLELAERMDCAILTISRRG